MQDALDAKLEHLERDFLVDVIEQSSWNVDNVSKRYSISKQELLNAIGESHRLKVHIVNTEEPIRSYRNSSL